MQVQTRITARQHLMCHSFVPLANLQSGALVIMINFSCHPLQLQRFTCLFCKLQSFMLCPSPQIKPRRAHKITKSCIRAPP